MNADAAVEVRAAVQCGKLELAVLLPMTMADGMRHHDQLALDCEGSHTTLQATSFCSGRVRDNGSSANLLIFPINRCENAPSKTCDD